jgi:hypothetical protein
MYNKNSIKKVIAISMIALVGVTGTACLPNEQAIFDSLTPVQQSSISQHEASKTASRDCYQAIAKHWPAGLQPWARKIVWRESRNIPSAANPRSSARGCFQMLLRYSNPFYKKVGCNNYMWANPDCNAKAAYQMYKVAGKSPWRVY